MQSGKDLNSKLEELNYLLPEKTIEESLNILTSNFPGQVVFTTSFGIEDQVISHIIFTNRIPVEVVTLDTGRLFPETYQVFNETIKKYNEKITVYYPNHEAVGKMVSEKGPSSFYYSRENRLECCQIRKVEPLGRALKGHKIWISGVRADQSSDRSKMKLLEFDSEKNMYKFHPLINWSLDEVEKYIFSHQIPYNSLHNKGFLSIGCEPCTRAIMPGEDIRAGRWWWEKGSKKECGLHINLDVQDNDNKK
jgi:phosphoadenosine phosphosulfate reductase